MCFFNKKILMMTKKIIFMIDYLCQNKILLLNMLKIPDFFKIFQIPGFFLALTVKFQVKQQPCTNNSLRINLQDNGLFLLTTAVYPRYRLDFFLANIKQKVARLLKSQVKNLGSRGLIKMVQFLLNHIINIKL